MISAFRFFEPDAIINQGLELAYQQIFKVAVGLSLKNKAAQEKFFSLHNEIDDDFKKNSRELLINSLDKFELSSMTTQQLHSIHNANNEKNLFGEKVNSDIEKVLCTLLLDNALFLLDSFLELYMKYLVFFCCMKVTDHFTIEIFRNAFKSNKSLKAEKVYGYFNEFIINKNDKWNPKYWGNTLMNYRNQTAHSKIIETAISEVEAFGRKRNAPTVDGVPVSFFVQNFENSAMSMITYLQPILYDVEWIAGPYRDGMYD